jgi:hypothetical protein
MSVSDRRILDPHRLIAARVAGFLRPMPDFRPVVRLLHLSDRILLEQEGRSDAAKHDFI